MTPSNGYMYRFKGTLITLCKALSVQTPTQKPTTTYCTPEYLPHRQLQEDPPQHFLPSFDPRVGGLQAWSLRGLGFRGLGEKRVVMFAARIRH